MPALKVEYAKSGRGKCSLTSCKRAILKHEVRIGTVITLPFGDDGAESVKWRHLCCFTERQLGNARTSGDLAAIEGYDDLAPVDRDLVDQMARGELVDKATIIGRIGDVANSPLAEQLGGKAGGASKAPAAPRKKAARTKKAATADVDSDATEELEVEVRAESGKPHCPYGANCFRTAADHFEQYSHDDGDSSASGGATETAVATRPVIVGKRNRK